MQVDSLKIKISVVLLLLGSYQCFFGQSLYTQTGTDPTWEELLENNTFPIGQSSSMGVLGSTIDVNNDLVEIGNNANRNIYQGIKIHTPPNSVIPRSDFPKWTRWYQEDGNTQVFRLFKNEENVHNSRKLAARVEAFGIDNWAEGEWHEWVGTFTIVKPHGCSILQVKNKINAWSVMINLSSEGHITLNHRRHQDDKIIARNMTGKSFELGVRDNGREYEVYYNGEKVGEGYYDRPEGITTFRWGMYVGSNPVLHDAMIFVTGATIDPYPGILNNPDTLKLTTKIEGQGTVSISPDKKNYTLNDEVSLTATPRTGGTFMGWEGDVAGSENPVYLVMNSNKVITATFEYHEDKAPFGETPAIIPGIIEAENYDFGGDGTSYHDTDRENKGYTIKGVEFRVNDDVDIDQHPTDGYIVGWTETGEWIEYTVDVQHSGIYEFEFYYSSELNAKLGLEINDESTLSNFHMHTTGSSSNFFPISTEVSLTAGEQVWRLNVEEGGFNLDRIVTEVTTLDVESHVAGRQVHIISESPSGNSIFLSESCPWEVISIMGKKMCSGIGSRIEMGQFVGGVYIVRFANQNQKIFLKKK